MESNETRWWHNGMESKQFSIIQSTISRCGCTGYFPLYFGYATKAARPANGASYFYNTDMADNLIICWDIDKNGNIEVYPLQNMWGLLMEENVLDAIIEACKKDKMEHPPEDRYRHNKAIIDKHCTNDYRPVARVKEIKIREPLECQIYIIKDTIRGVYKIGRGVCAKTRFKGLKTANPGIELIAFYDGVDSDETYLHDKFTSLGQHIDGEWFRLDAEDFDEIKSYFSATIDDFPF